MPDCTGTTYLPTGEQTSVFDASERYRSTDTPLVILAGKEYGTGSSRDWAAKGPALLGVRAVIAESYERIHRSNLVGMGIIPLQFVQGENAESLGLDGTEVFSIAAITADMKAVTVNAQKVDGSARSVSSANSTLISFETSIRIDTPNEFAYFENGGILHYVLRRRAD